MGLLCFLRDRDLSRFRDGELSLADHRRVQEHLGRCARCADRLEEFRRIDLWMAGLAEAVPGRPPSGRLAVAAAVAAAILASLAANAVLTSPPGRPVLGLPSAPAQALDQLYARLAESR